MRTMLKSKLHRARVTQSNVDYEGSITIDKGLMEAADILPYERVEVLNVNNAARFSTYAIEGDRNSGVICLNGAAARLADKGDVVIILTYQQVAEKDIKDYHPRLVYVDRQNRIAHTSGVPEKDWTTELLSKM